MGNNNLFKLSNGWNGNTFLDTFYGGYICYRF